jgi:hypothetical protein
MAMGMASTARYPHLKQVSPGKGATAMNDTDSVRSGTEIAVQLEQWLQNRERMKACGDDVVHLDQQILPFKTKYVRSGAIYGANSAGMVRWYAEARRDGLAPAAMPTTTEAM